MNYLFLIKQIVFISLGLVLLYFIVNLISATESPKNNNIQILWASTREAYNYIQAKQLGCHIITVPPSIIEKIEKFGKSFQKLTTDTVKGFLIDTKKSKFQI